MTKTSTTLVTLLALSAAVLSVNVPPKHYQNCGALDQMDNRCNTCYKSIPQPDGNCGEQIKNGDCWIYAREDFNRRGLRNECGWCAPGFQLNIKGRGKDRCLKAKNPIANCGFEILRPDGKVTCLTCTPGHVTNLANTQCVKIPAGKALDNCLWTSNFGGRYECMRCALGHTLVLESGKCIATPKEITGCGFARGNRLDCQNCDIFNGYSAQPDNTCAKN